MHIRSFPFLLLSPFSLSVPSVPFPFPVALQVSSGKENADHALV